MKIFFFDIEGNSLYEGIDRFWCAWVKDLKTGRKVGFRPHQFYEFIQTLSKADILVGQNIVDFDVPALFKLGGPWSVPPMFDTLVLARLLDPDKLGGNGLKNWGKELGILKGDYGEQEEAWDRFSEEMFDYCEQDVEVTEALFLHLCKKAGFDPYNPPKAFLDFGELCDRFEEVTYEA